MMGRIEIEKAFKLIGLESEKERRAILSQGFYQSKAHEEIFHYTTSNNAGDTIDVRGSENARLE